MRALTSLATAVAIGTSLIAATPATAGLGSAAIKGSTKGYEAWCGEKGNDCKVQFANGKITVNNKDSVDFDNITYITRTSDYNKWDYSWKITFGIEYLEENMENPEFAEIIFGHLPTSKRFWMDLKRACRQCKDRDATQVEVEVDIKE